MLKKLRTLLISNNRVSRIESNLEQSLPNLETLILNNNQIQDFSVIDSLSTLASLKFLSLMDNPIIKKSHYRKYCVHKLRSLLVLDFKKVSKKERTDADAFFSTQEGMEIVGQVENEVLVQDAIPEEESNRIKEAVSNVKSYEEAARLERILRSGRILK